MQVSRYGRCVQMSSEVRTPHGTSEGESCVLPKTEATSHICCIQCTLRGRPWHSRMSTEQ